MSSSSSSPPPPPSDRHNYSPTLTWNPRVEEYFVYAYGAEHFTLISEALTRPSCYSCLRVNTLKSFSNAVMRKLLTIFDESEINDDSEIAIGTSRDLTLPTEPSQSFSISKCPYPGLDNVVFIRGSGPHRICYESQPVQSIKEVIVSRKCAEAVLRGAQVYVPGVLACSSHVEKGDKVAVSVAVEQPAEDGGWTVGITRGTILQGLQSDPHYQERNHMYIGQGVTLMSRAGIFRASEGIAIQMTERVYRLPSFNDVLEGEIFLQNLPSIVTACVLDPQPGERILDMCAAPGGKTTAIAILMKDKGEVVAIDRSHNKVMDILKLAAEMQLSCIKAYKLDALKSVQRTKEPGTDATTVLNTGTLDAIVEGPLSPSPAASDKVSDGGKHGPNLTNVQTGDERKPDTKKYFCKVDIGNGLRKLRNGPGRNHCIGGRVEQSKGFMSDSFDRVLLDAPCSALGLRPRLFAGEETIESLRNHAKYQRRMFDQAIQLVRPGGVIVYSTCTINPGENEALVRYALDTYKFLTLASQNPKIGGPGVVGRCKFNENHVEEWLTESEAELVQRFDPSSSLDTIGFFIAKFDVGQKGA